MANTESFPSIVVLHQGVGDAFRYRCVHLGQQLALLGLPCVIQEFRPGAGQPIAACDLLVLHRVPLDGFLGRQIRDLQRAGTLVLFDTDDLVFQLDEALSFSESIGDPWLKRVLYREGLRNLRRALELADGALVSTEALARSARQLGKAIWVHRNAFSQEMLDASEAAYRGRKTHDPKVVIGYASGTATHENDFVAAKPALKGILGKYQATELWLVGHIEGGTDWGQLSSRVRRMPFTSWRDLPRLLAEFDVNLAPVELGRTFCEAKSEIKYVEAALVRVPTVASGTESFSFAIRNGSNGFLASNEAEWFEALERLVADTGLRERMGMSAYEDVIARYHPRVRSGELRAVLGEVLSRSDHRRFDLGRGSEVVEHRRGALGAPAQGQETPAAGLPAPSHLRKAWYSLRYHNPRMFLLQVLSFLALRLQARGLGEQVENQRQRRPEA